MVTALITGITGQDGSYLSEFLFRRGYRVVGTIRNSRSREIGIHREIPGKAEILEDDLLDQARLENILKKYKPAEVYNFAAHSFLGESFKTPVLTGEYIGLGVARILEAIRTVAPGTRFFQASSSEMFGIPSEVPQTERTPFHPRNPYGVAKVYAHLMTGLYREVHGLFACCGILYNHESPRRKTEFVTRKITNAAARIKLGLQGELRLGNLDARRDWGFAGDYVEAMWLMLQQTRPDDYILATGETHSVQEFCEEAFRCIGLDYREYVVTEPTHFRPAEAAQLVGNSERARRNLGWRPKVSFQGLVRLMMEAEMKLVGHSQTQGEHQ